jgi:uncharacterized protein involved in tolerance to divalent cations
MEAVMINWNCGNLDLLRRVSRYLVQEKLVASVEIIPWFESISLLNNQLETTQMSKALLITRKELYERVQAEILEQSKDEIPEIYMVLIQQGNPEFLRWIEEITAIPVGN